MSKRELILARLFTLVGSVRGITAYRDLDSIPAGTRPATNMLDNDDLLPQPFPENLTHAGTAQSVIMMLPTIDLMIGAQPATSGTELNAVWETIIPPIFSDAAKANRAKAGSLAALIGASGRVVYLGTQTRFSHSYTMDCDATIRLAIHYLFDPLNP